MDAVQQIPKFGKPDTAKNGDLPEITVRSFTPLSFTKANTIDDRSSVPGQEAVKGS